jgi:hypothetical protein
MRIHTFALTTTLAAVAAATLTFSVVATTAGTSHADPVAPAESRIEQLNLGEYWFGPDIQHEDLVGKVVLVELWGS